MKVGKNSKKWLRAVIVSSALVSASVPISTFAGESFQRLGRTLGFGWGDGYHACADSGCRLCADLPPRSFAATHGAGHRLFTAMGHHAGGTFYDRFDAANGHCCDAGCDSAVCDGAPQMLIQGSQVVRGPDLPPRLDLGIASIGEPREMEREMGPVPNLKSEMGPVPDLNSDGGELASATSSRAFLPEKQYPIRPQPPARITPKSIVFPMASDRRPSGIPLPIEGAESLNGPSSSGPSNPGRAAKAVPSNTPAPIHPIHPWDQPRPSVSSNVSAKSTEAVIPENRSIKMPLSPQDKPTTTVLPAVSPFAIPQPPHREIDSIKVEKRSDKPVAKPAQSVSIEQPAAKTAVIDVPVSVSTEFPKSASTSPEPLSPSNLLSPSHVIGQPRRSVARQRANVARPKRSVIVPAVPDDSNELALAEPVSPAASVPQTANLVSLGRSEVPEIPSVERTKLAKPHRLGSASPVRPTVAKSSQTLDPGLVRANPFASRPVLELARRPEGSRQGVIYQPSAPDANRQR